MSLKKRGSVIIKKIKREKRKNKDKNRNRDKDKDRDKDRDREKKAIKAGKNRYQKIKTERTRETIKIEKKINIEKQGSMKKTKREKKLNTRKKRRSNMIEKSINRKASKENEIETNKQEDMTTSQARRDIGIETAVRNSIKGIDSIMRDITVRRNLKTTDFITRDTNKGITMKKNPQLKSRDKNPKMRATRSNLAIKTKGKSR